jgi:hypothetical protein
MISFNSKASQTDKFHQTVSQKLNRPGDLPKANEHLLSELLRKQDFAADLEASAYLPRHDLPTYLYAWVELSKNAENQNESIAQPSDQVLVPDRKLQQLEEILLKRTSYSFLLQTWSVYQQNINSNYLKNLLFKMVNKCSVSIKDRPFISWIRQELINGGSDLNLINQLVRLTLDQPDQVEKMYAELKNYQQSEIYFPRLKNYIPGVSRDCSGNTEIHCLVPVLIYLDIMPDSDFLLSFLLEYFQQADDEQVEINANLWRYTVKALPSSSKHLIIQAFYSKFRLEAKWLEINRTIELELSDKNVWNKLENRARQYFHQWQIVDRINQHIAEQPRKILFYKNYQLQVRKIFNLAEDILIVSFGDFFLADYNSETEAVWLLDKILLEMLQEGGHTDVRQFEGNRQTPTARELIMNKSSSNLARLPLDDVNILYAHDFISQQTLKIRPK